MKLKKILALTMSATMAMGIAMPVMAADPPSVTAPIYSFEAIDVVVPTTYKVAFNPEGLTVKTGDSTTSTDQILSKNYGILNKSNKDMVCTVALKVEDKNTGDNKVEFVNSATDVTNAKDGEYKIYLTAVPADATEVKVGTSAASADKATADTALDDVTMTGATASAVTLKAGDNKVAFKLDKAEYEAISGSEVTLGSTSENNVKDNYQIKSVAAAGKGITAFTFGGSMNAKADWTKLQSGIEITPVYTSKVATSDATVITGTGAMVNVGPEMTVSNAGVITITGMTADKNFAKLEIENSNGGPYDVNDLPITQDAENYSDAEGGDLVIVLGNEWLSTLQGVAGKAILTLTDGAVVEVAINIPA